ncbi:protein adenylyltransferase SelO [Acidaminobacter sp.]|uniref:protein adenylyltransferase SelO n=1 Tax=Acidaminobacter sp. TaxID=1872102 RepID=UPI00256195A2|nr:YdiU family protein [Acidaminobacter sp.]MDK9711804.1 YdiU family protein [Acidaminobacter sp.]
MTKTNFGWNFDNSYARLPKLLYTHLEPTPVRLPKLIRFNSALAEEMGLDPDALNSQAGTEYLAGNRTPEGAEPLAQAYAGHQFGHFTMLGDGRAILLGEQVTIKNDRLDLQLKGSGRTPYSRGGDGRAALGPMLREYLISEAMHALGVSTTRSLAVVSTGEPVYREKSLPGAILTRVASSHLRVGTFQFAYSRGSDQDLRLLTDYAIARHDPGLSGSDRPYYDFLNAVMNRQARLIAKWQSIGFIHGVMNTDNMAISGETIDYGPCAFMDAYDPATVFSSIDAHGRYAFGNQPYIAAWNLARFAETIMPLLDPDEEKAFTLAQEAISGFSGLYRSYWLDAMGAKLGLFNNEPEDEGLIEALLEIMHRHHADYTNTFLALTFDRPEVRGLFEQPDFQQWKLQWQERLQRQSQSAGDVQERMKGANPAVIPRNHRVEEALEAAVSMGDFSVLDRLSAVLAKPYAHTPDQAAYAAPAPESARPYRTFCGT